MNITYQMVQLPPLLLFILMVVFGGIVAGVSTFLFRRYTNVKILRSHNEVTGFLFLAIASFYSLLLSFIVFVVWGQLNSTHTNASKEGSSAMALYRDIKFFPDSLESKQLMDVYLGYINHVLEDELPNMEDRKISRKTAESFNDVFFAMEHLDTKSKVEVQLMSVMFSHLNELASFRGLRTGSMETKAPPPMWYPMLLGALITLLCAMLLDIEHVRMHISLNALLGAFIGMFFFIIILLDHPYTGSQRIQPKSYEQILILEHWAYEAQIKQFNDN
jgi:hypothetical protein